MGKGVATRLIVLGKGQGKVLSSEDIQVARAARAVKEITQGKGKRGRRRESAALEVEEPEPEVALTIDAPVLRRAPTSCTDDMRLLHERREYRFLFPLVRIWVLEGKKPDAIIVRSILGAMEEDGVMLRLQVIRKPSVC